MATSASEPSSESGSGAKKLDPKWVTVAGLVVVMLFGILVAYSYHLRNVRERWVGEPPIKGELMQHLVALNRDGKEVSTKELAGKIWVCSYLYTDCPAQCLGSAANLELLFNDFKDRGNFHLVSVSANPAGDTPEKMDGFLKNQGIDIPEWWFLTGEEERIHKYMRKYFSFAVPKKNTDPKLIATQGELSHDPWIALVDGDGHIRGYYDLVTPGVSEQHEKSIRRDIAWLLDELEGKEPGAASDADASEGTREAQ